MRIASGMLGLGVESGGGASAARVGLAAALSLMAAGVCLAQPANDTCSGATPMVDGDNAFDNRTSTRDSTSGCSRGGESFSGTEVWYTYTAPATGVRNFTIKNAYRGNGAQFDSQLTIYDACGGTILACDDDSGSDLWSKIYHFSVTSGTTYVIRLGNWGVNLVASRQGSGTLNISPPQQPLQLDDCELAVPIVGQPPTVPFSTVGLTDSDMQGWDCEYQRDGWFAWTPSVSGIAKINACAAAGVNNANNIAIGIYESCGTPPVLCTAVFQDPPNAVCFPTICFSITAGQTYYVRYGSGTEVSGNMEFEIRPANADLEIPAGAIAEPGNCADALSNDPNSGCNVTPSVFTPLQLCTTRRGTASTRLAPVYSLLWGAVVPYIDEDWYAFTLDTDQSVSITGQSEFPPTARIVVGCPGTTVGQISVPILKCSGDYSLNYTSPVLVAGTYYYVVSPQTNGRSASACGYGDKYWFTITGSEPCPPSNENCCRGTTCNAVASGACTGMVAGSASITVSSCGSGSSLGSCCYADFNHDGTQSIDDLFLYFNAYFTGSPWANYGGNGVETPTIDDLFLYINAYFTGCT